MPPELTEKLGTIGLLVVFGGAVIRWLLVDRKEIAQKLQHAEEREREVIEKRADDQIQSSALFAQSQKLVSDELQENTRAIEKLQEKVERCSKNS
jgi:hypothetical protein